MLPINYTAVIVAAVVAFIIGFLMHGPLFGKLWMKLANIHPTGKEKLSDMYGQMFMNLLMNLLSALVMAGIFSIAFSSMIIGDANFWRGMICAFWLWLGFQVPVTSMEVIWMKRPFKLWLFESISALIVFLAMGAVIGGM